tara:strand:- start:99 stop:962 length:864 start_codon:yes stop_codon:yes gene_type:complete
LPELPEVETVRKGLEKKASDFYINKVEVLKERSIASRGGSKRFISMITGLRVCLWKRRGKYLIASLQKENNQTYNSKIHGWWVIHLRMTGQFQFYKKSSSPCSHTRVRLWNREGIELRFVDIRNFGQMWFIDGNSSPIKDIPGLKKLGPEPFSKEFNSSYLKNKLKGKKRSIKSSLLDQTLVAGAGNIYADESLFYAGILPTRESGKIKDYELTKLCNSLIKILKISIGEGGTTFSDFRDLEGTNGKYGGQALVYRRENKPCKTCGTKIKRTKISGRSTHWCPSCQF